MATESPFRVLVRDLPASRRIEITPAFVAEAVKGLPLRDALDDGGAPVAGDGGVAALELYGDADGSSVQVHGTIHGHVTVACSRCVGPASLPVDEEVRVTFLPQHAVAADGDGKAAPAKDRDKDKGGDDDDGVELVADDLDVFPFDGETVDLEPLIREQFVLAVPFAPLCREDCAGLCPQCGADRNREPCSCERPIDPRFEALAGLKLPPS